MGDGNFTIALRPDWAPHGVERVVAMAERGFFTDLPFFRVLSGFLIQFGISPDRIKNEYWRAQGTIKDDTPIGVPFTDGVVSFAGYSTDSRTTHLLCAPALSPPRLPSPPPHRRPRPRSITMGDQSAGLGKRPWEVAIGQLVGGKDVIAGIYSGYGDKLDQGRMQGPGAAEYIAGFPQMNRILGCSVRGLPVEMGARDARAKALEMYPAEEQPQQQVEEPEPEEEDEDEDEDLGADVDEGEEGHIYADEGEDEGDEDVDDDYEGDVQADLAGQRQQAESFPEDDIDEVEDVRGS